MRLSGEELPGGWADAELESEIDWIKKLDIKEKIEMLEIEEEVEEVQQEVEEKEAEKTKQEAYRNLIEVSEKLLDSFGNP